MSGTVLFVAFHFPPVKGSSGIQRTLSFARYLKEYGWNAVVLTVHPRAHREVSYDQMDDIPADVPVVRAQAWDSGRHLALRGRYFRFTALPDPWMSWRFDAVRQGKRLLRAHRIDAILSTYPIATSLQIGSRLKASSGLPWIVDFRDVMVDPDYPEDPHQRRAFERIESDAVRRSDAVLVTAPSSIRMLSARYPDQAGRIHLIENGFDERFFADAVARPVQPVEGRPVTLVHSGLIYQVDRDPAALFDAVRTLKERGLNAERLQINLRAPGDPERFHGQIAERGIQDIVRITPGLEYRAALAEMMEADGLMILQGRTCNHLIPAKLYEYVRAGRPVLGLTEHEGDTAAVMRTNGLDAIASLHDPQEIAAVLERFVEDVRAGTASVPSAGRALACERRSRAGELAQLLDQTC